MDKKQAYQDKFQAQLDEWEAQIDVLKAQAQKAEADARLKYMKEVDDLKAIKKKAEARMNELQHAQGEAWQDVRAGVQAAWDELGDAVKDARKRFS